MIRRALFRASPEGAFEALYRRHVRDVYSWSLAILDRQADAEDATQTTFMNAYRALERGERPRDTAKWLHTIALNVCREHYRRAGRRPDEVSLDEDPGDLVLDPPTPEIGDVMRGLSALPFNQRAALVMREFEGRSLNEIASALEVSSSAVEALLFRARRALREQLEGSLTCAQAEEVISRQLDGVLPKAERGPLRAHLRECPDCASLARRLRAQRRAVRSLPALLPLPATLKFWKLAGAGSTSAPAVTGTGALLTKVAVVVAAGTATLGAGYAALHSHPGRSAPPPAAKSAVVTAAGAGGAGRGLAQAEPSAIGRGALARPGHASAARPGGARPGSHGRGATRPAGARRGASQAAPAGSQAGTSSGSRGVGHRSAPAGAARRQSAITSQRRQRRVRARRNATRPAKARPSHPAKPAPALSSTALPGKRSGTSHAVALAAGSLSHP